MPRTPIIADPNELMLHSVMCRPQLCCMQALMVDWLVLCAQPHYYWDRGVFIDNGWIGLGDEDRLVSRDVAGMLLEHNRHFAPLPSAIVTTCPLMTLPADLSPPWARFVRSFCKAYLIPKDRYIMLSVASYAATRPDGFNESVAYTMAQSAAATWNLWNPHINTALMHAARRALR